MNLYRRVWGHPTALGRWREEVLSIATGGLLLFSIVGLPGALDQLLSGIQLWHNIGRLCTFILLTGLLLARSIRPELRIIREYVEPILTASTTLLGAINNVLDLARDEAGRMELEITAFDVHRLVSDTLDLVAGEARRKKLDLSAQLDASLPRYAAGDSVRIRQIVLNLLANAVKFTHYGSVSVAARAETTERTSFTLVLDVRDTGIGIPPDQLAQIFEPFTQADSSTNRHYGGSGLGLAIVHRLVERMCGQITVASTPGQGSTFTVALPLEQASAPASSSPTPLARAEHPLRVLVVEDNPINQQVARELLVWLGHSVTVVDNGFAALTAVIEGSYDVVLMDIHMPDLDGAEATRRIRARPGLLRQPRIIALTANALPGDRERLLRSGLDDYLSKPLQPGDLQRALSMVTPAALPAEAVTPLVDEAVLGQMYVWLGESAADALAQMLQVFEGEIAKHISDLATALRHKDEPRAAAIAHRVRGGCVQLGAQVLAHRLAEIERRVDLHDHADLADALTTCYEQTVAELGRLVRGLLTERTFSSAG